VANRAAPFEQSWPLIAKIRKRSLRCRRQTTAENFVL